MIRTFFRIYKRIILLIMLLILGAAFWFYGCLRTGTKTDGKLVWEERDNAQGTGTEYYFENGEISATIVFGQEGRIPEGKTVPVTIDLSGRTESFSGILRITLPGENGNGIDYQTAVSCEKGRNGHAVLQVPQLGNASCFGVEILNSFGTVLVSRTIVPDWASGADANREVLIGVLSDHFSDLEYLNGLEIRTGDEVYSLTLVPYTRESFPDDLKRLSALGGILIDRFDTSLLDSGQRVCLKRYVEKEGGSLLVCTGEHGKQTMEGIRGILKAHGTIADTQFLDFTVSASGGTEIPAQNMNLWNAEEWKEEELSQPESFFSRQLGRGEVFLLSYSLTARKFRSMRQKEEISRVLFDRILMNGLLSSYNEDEGQWYLGSSLYSFMPGRQPDTFYYGLFFIIYIAALIFGGYYFLRKVRRREIVWFVIPFLAGLFTLAMVIRTIGASGTEVNSLSLLQIFDTDERYDENYLLYQNANGESGNVILPPGVRMVEPAGYTFLSEIMDVPNAACSRKDYTVNQTPKNYEIGFSENIPGTSFVLKILSSGVNIRRQVFEGELIPENTTFSGTVTNAGSMDFSTVLIIRGYQYYSYGELKHGETLKIHADDVNMLADASGESIAVSDQSEEVESILPYLQMKYIGNASDDNCFMIIGISREENGKFFEEPDTLDHLVRVYINRFPVDESIYGKYIASLNASCLNEKDQTEAGGESVMLLKNGVLPEGEPNVVYSFDKAAGAVRLIRNKDSYRGRIYALNYRTGEYERILKDPGKVLPPEELAAYLSEDNKLRIRYQYKAEEGEETMAPVLSAVTYPDGDF